MTRISSVPIDDSSGDGRSRRATPSRTEIAYRRARRHSLLVRVLKVTLPAAGVAVIAVLLAAVLLSHQTGVSVDIAKSGIKDGKLVMANPELSGETKAKLPYNMTAERAIQDLTNTNIITLEKIDAKLPFSGEETATIDAPSGVFDNANNTLDIDSDINIRTSSGMTARLKSAKVDIGGGNLETDDPVDIDMNGSRIAADSLSVRERGKVLVFEKRVRVTIPPERLKQAGDR